MQILICSTRCNLTLAPSGRYSPFDLWSEAFRNSAKSSSKEGRIGFKRTSAKNLSLILQLLAVAIGESI